MTETVDTFKNQRIYIRGKVTRRCDTITQNIADLSVEECTNHITVLNELSQKLSDLDLKVGGHIASQDDEDALNVELVSIEQYEGRIETELRKLNERVKQVQPQVNHVQTHSTASSSEHDPQDHLMFDRQANVKLRLPEIPLPKFTNSEEECLTQFFINFESVIDKYKLSDYEKFILLEKQLSDEPLTLIKSLTGLKRSYDDAKTILNQAFAQPVKKKYNIIKRLKKLSFDPVNPVKFISDITLLLSAFDDLEIDIEMILQYFVWAALPATYQTQLLHITNNSYPSLE